MLLVDELREAWHSEPRNHRVALLIILAIGVVLRAAHLAQPIRYDEAVTYMFFVRHPWSDALSLYTYPNNHLFHTLLAKISVSAFGNSPWALRAPAFIAGVLIIPAAYAVTRLLYRGRAALFAAAIVASSGVLTLYSTNARGYSLVVLAFLLLVLCGIRVLSDAGSAPWFTFAVVAALGLWTVPVMLFPLGAVALWLALSLLVGDRGAELRRLAVALGVAIGLALLAYSPVIAREGLGAITRNRFVASVGWYEFFEQLPPTIREALLSWSLGIPPLVSLALAACAVVALRRHASLSRFPIGIPLAAFAWCAWLLVVNHRAPFPRVWLWLFPVAAGLAGAGIARIMEQRPRARVILEQRAEVFAIAFAFAAALSVAMSRSVLKTRDTGTFPDARQAAAALSRVLQPGDRVLAAIPSNAPLSYYLDKLGVSESYLTADERRARRVIVVVNQSEGQTLNDLAARSSLGDSGRFQPPTAIARFSASLIVLFERRDATTK